MSKFKAALITAIIGSSSAAMASPGLSWSAGAEFSFGSAPAPVIRDHRVEPAYGMPSNYSTSIQLASYLNLATGRDVLRPQINLRNATGLTLRSTSGMAYIQKVTVRFQDGSVQVMPINAWMTTRNPALQLSLRAGRIDSIIIAGTPSGRASYQVFATQSAPVELPHPPTHPGGWDQGGYNNGMSVGSSMTFQNTDGRKFITVGSNAGSFSTLRLEGASGRTFVTAVKVTFTNGQEQLMTGLERTLARGESMDLKLDGRGQNGIKEICVWTDLSGQAIVTSNGTFNATLL